MKKAPYPPFSPDIAVSKFYLFDYLKGRLAGLKFESPNELFGCINEILKKIPKETLINVFLEWEKRFKQVIENNREYI